MKPFIKKSLLRIAFTTFLLVFSVIALSHGYIQHSADEKYYINNAYVKPSIPGTKNSAAYFSLINTTGETVHLVDANSTIAEITEVHEHAMVDGLMKMQKVDKVEIPGKRSVKFVPGGYHVMFIGLKQTINEGDTIEFTLVLDNGETLNVNATAKKPKDHSHHKHHKHH